MTYQFRQITMNTIYIDFILTTFAKHEIFFSTLADIFLVL